MSALPLAVGLLVLGAVLLSSGDARTPKEPAPPDPKDPDTSRPCSPDPKGKITIFRAVRDGESPVTIAEKITGDGQHYANLVVSNPDFSYGYHYEVTFPNGGSDNYTFDHFLTDEELHTLTSLGGTPHLRDVTFEPPATGKFIVIPETWFSFYRTAGDGTPVEPAENPGTKYPPC